MNAKQPLKIGSIIALNGCVGILFGAAAQHNHKNSKNKSSENSNKQELEKSEGKSCS